jgi:Fe-S cluster biosynthesis and repair protein YggX
MARTVECVILKREAEGLDYPPIPGELGQRLYESVSKEAWARWTAQQTMIVNEYRLNLADPRAQKMLTEAMESFFYGSGLQPPPDWVPPQERRSED